MSEPNANNQTFEQILNTLKDRGQMGFQAFNLNKSKSLFDPEIKIDDFEHLGSSPKLYFTYTQPDWIVIPANNLPYHEWWIYERNEKGLYELNTDTDPSEFGNVAIYNVQDELSPMNPLAWVVMN